MNLVSFLLFFSFLLLLYFFYFLFRVFVYLKIIWHKRVREKDVLPKIKQEPFYNELLVDAMLASPFHVQLEKNTISGSFVLGNSSKVIVFLHGYHSNRWNMVKYASYFFERGWNLVFFDFRACGNSTGRIGSLGGLEVKDLSAVMGWVYQKIENPEEVILFGESVGAVAASVYSSTDKKITGIIVDSVYSSAIKVVRLKIQKIPLLPGWFVERVLQDVVDWIQYFPRYKITGINPEYSLMRTSVPLLLIHGDEDRNISPSMSYGIYKKRKGRAPTRIYFCIGAGFSGSFKTDPQTYFNIVDSFLKDRDKESLAEFSRIKSNHWSSSSS